MWLGQQLLTVAVKDLAAELFLAEAAVGHAMCHGCMKSCMPTKYALLTMFCKQQYVISYVQPFGGDFPAT
jgi:hypothetical protein